LTLNDIPLERILHQIALYGRKWVAEYKHTFVQVIW